jgi:MoxR-like ATPase
MSQAIALLHRELDAELGKVMVGLQAASGVLSIALIARGHVLLQGAPGLGKTLLARTLARTLGGEFRRIQGTSDMMPSDIIGVHVLEEGGRGAAGRFVFRPGPLWADVVLFDEINRTAPRTQSALLEAMEERQVSIDREVRALPEGFLVLATQNPLELEGTYPLPESQLDRFMLRLEVGYPARAAESEILRRYGALASGTQRLGEVCQLSSERIEAARAEAAALHVADALVGYILDLAQASRAHPQLALGLSTRGALALLTAARVACGLRGGDFVTPDDVKEAAVPVMAHRLALTPEAQLAGTTDIEVVRGLLAATPVPR